MSEINNFCIKECSLGIKKSEEFLDKNSSAFDAAMDMCFFVEECKKTCPYKDKFDK
jgi:hypothetical protein